MNLVEHCMAVRPISEGGEAGPIFCGREKGHDGWHRNMTFEWKTQTEWADLARVSLAEFVEACEMLETIPADLRAAWCGATVLGSLSGLSGVQGD